MVFSPKLVKRYKELKEEAADYLLLMQVGAFMQVMDQDARACPELHPEGPPELVEGLVEGRSRTGRFKSDGLEVANGRRGGRAVK